MYFLPFIEVCFFIKIYKVNISDLTIMIYIYCNPDIVRFFIDLINALIFNYKALFIFTGNIDEINQLSNDNKIIFIQSIPNEWRGCHNKNIFVFNTEQASRENILTSMQNIHPDDTIIDYSLANIKYIEKYKKNILYLPYLVNPEEIYNYPKADDIAIIGSWDSDHRKNIKQNIELAANITQVEGFDKERDSVLFKHKILLNVHYDQTYKCFEQMRCNRCILNRMIVITERSDDVDFELKEFIIECDYEEIVSTTLHVLNNYEYFYEKLFKNFNIDLINQKYKQIGDSAVKTLT